MGKLDELRNFVKQQFDQAETTDKSTIDMLARIQNDLEDATKEQEAIEARNAELVKSYKDLVKHTSFKDEHNVPTDPVSTGAPSFEEILKQFAEKE